MVDLDASVPPLPATSILGAGSMGGAILAGLIASGTPVEGGVTVTNRSAEKAAVLADLPGVTSLALNDDPDANLQAVRASDIVLIGVKPAMVPELLQHIAPALRPGAVVVSLAAGVTLATFAAVLGDDVAVIRSMPNTPAVVRAAVTGLASGGAVTAEQAAAVRRLFETVGVVVEVPEDQIDALGTVSGSGPAYVFLFIEEFTRAALARGFDETQARLLAEQTFVGAAELLAAADVGPAELRRRVTSPGGTTERAIAVLQDADLGGLFERATDAALARSRELAEGS